MDPIQNNGMSNYAMTVPQQQNDMQIPQDDYSSMPMVYDPSMDDKKSSASSGAGMKALAALTIAGLALWGGHAWGSKGAKDKIEKAINEAKTEIKSEADKAIKEAKSEADKVIKEAKAEADKLKTANDKAYEIADKEYTGILDRKRDLRKAVKEALRPNEAEVKKTEEAVTKATEDAAGKAEGVAEKAKEAADDAAESVK